MEVERRYCNELRPIFGEDEKFEDKKNGLE
jgi:hypothetical protein